MEQTLRRSPLRLTDDILDWPQVECRLPATEWRDVRVPAATGLCMHDSCRDMAEADMALDRAKTLPACGAPLAGGAHCGLRMRGNMHRHLSSSQCWAV